VYGIRTNTPLILPRRSETAAHGPYEEFWHGTGLPVWSAVIATVCAAVNRGCGTVPSDGVDQAE
jgi:hypothetical protein